MKKLNVLILSLSRKISLIKVVKRALNRFSKESILFGSDSDPRTIGHFFVDVFWEMPPIDNLSVEELLDYCKRQSIDVIIPTRDGELLFFAKIRDKLAKENVHVMVSKEEAITITLDKVKFYQTMKALRFPVIPADQTLQNLNAKSYVVKERYGSGSKSIGLNMTKSEALKKAETLTHPIFQPYIQGEEISVDCYVDLNGQSNGIICRSRDYVVNGESQVTTTFKDESLEQTCSQAAQSLGLTGHVMFQLVRTHDNDYFLECNPRFGGASSLSIAMGLDSFYWYFTEIISNNPDLKFDRSVNEKQLIRYPEDLIRDNI